jgi:hypothetical protein
MPATASTATAVDRRMARSVPPARDAGGSSPPSGQPPALNPPRTVPASSSCSAAARIEQGSGGGETGAGHGLLLRDRLGGIWEVASGANRPEPVPTELKQSF